MQKQNSLHLTLHGSGDSRGLRVGFEIDGDCLVERLRETETLHARGEGAEALAGNYGWPLLTRRLLRHLSGDLTEGVLLNCPCGMPDCWPFAVEIRVQPRFVVWERFRQLRRMGAWHYRGLEPLRFPRLNYLRELAPLQAALKKPARLVPTVVACERGTFAPPCAL